MLSASGISGFEQPISSLIGAEWKRLTDELHTSRLGSLHALRKAATPGAHPSLMIAAHMDAIGLMVREIRDGFLFISPIGGVDPRVLPGQLVTIHGERDLRGVVQMLPDRLWESSKNGSAPGYSRLFIDTGLNQSTLARNVRVGNTISFANPPISFDGKYISGHSLDNRASVAALTVCLEELRNYQLQWDLWCAATSQEEVHGMGAITSTFELMPQIGIAVDVTFAQEAGLNTHETFALGKGVTLGIGGNIHPALLRAFKRLAEEMDMPYALEPMPRSSGTDAMVMQIIGAGVPTFVLGIPIRYMHTPVEMAALNDIRRAGRLLARFITSLDFSSLSALFDGGEA